MKEQINKPIGLKAVCDEIENVCEKAKLYKSCGLKPNHLLINLDQGFGRTTLAEYIVDMYKLFGIIDFQSGMDDYIEYSFEGSIQQMRNVFSDIASSAIYKNEFNDVVVLSISDIATHQNENQYMNEFLAGMKNICNYANVILYVKYEPTNNEERLIDKLFESIENLKRIYVEKYTIEDLIGIAGMSLRRYGYKVEDNTTFYRSMVRAMKCRKMLRVKEVIRVAEELFFTAEIPEFDSYYEQTINKNI